jgi:hypothetical protein
MPSNAHPMIDRNQQKNSDNKKNNQRNTTNSNYIISKPSNLNGNKNITNYKKNTSNLSKITN